MTQKRRPTHSKTNTKNAILRTCVKLFLEQGYSNTTLSQIAHDTGISLSSFQNAFGTKDGVLLELAKIMFDHQFAAARSVESQSLKPIFVYAAETSIQLTLTELNENLRDVYVAAYSNGDAAEYIYQSTSGELEKIFSEYNPDCDESDFYEYDIGSAGIMRGFMSRKCDRYFTLEKKLTKFLKMTLRTYNVPAEEIEETIAFVLSLDIVEISNDIMHRLFKSLAMKFHFELNA